MTLLASTMTNNLELTPFVENYINQIIKKAERTYMQSKRFISNSYLEKTKSNIKKKLEKQKFRSQF